MSIEQVRSVEALSALIALICSFVVVTLEMPTQVIMSLISPATEVTLVSRCRRG